MAFYYDEYKSFLFYQIFMANYFESTLVYDDDEFIREKHLPPLYFFTSLSMNVLVGPSWVPCLKDLSWKKNCSP